ncbi:protein FAM107B [Cyprinodon tularosa]|uniref:protein FAM107B n=1 Tax=Cyprinodon tularosa TaxID=77115 RepID=UPI0018E25A97|nr:protein FAM107B [Cyprinodon tularosa]
MHRYQTLQGAQKRNKRNRVQCWVSPPHQVTENQQQEEDDLIKPKKLINPILASLQQRALHQELLFCHKQGFLPRKKSELHRVLENKAREQLRKREQALRPRSDLEVKLQRRLQKLELYELEEKRWRAGLKNVPEFTAKMDILMLTYGGQSHSSIILYGNAAGCLIRHDLESSKLKICCHLVDTVCNNNQS